MSEIVMVNVVVIQIALNTGIFELTFNIASYISTLPCK